MIAIRTTARDCLPCILPVIAAALWITLSGHDGGHVMAVMALIGVAATLSSLAGFAFSALCGAMLFHLNDDPVQVVQILITCSIANQAAMTWSIRTDIDWRALLPYLAGGTLGLIPGIWILLNVDRGLYMHVLGAFLAINGAYRLLGKPVVLSRKSPLLETIIGFLSGIAGGAAGFPSAFLAVWAAMQGWDKRRQRALLQPVILILQVAALLGVALARLAHTAGPAFDPATLLYIPASLLGTSLGMALYRNLTDRQFGKAVNLLMLASGLTYAA